ncbi:MAG: sugar nucleotide-binding protein [Alphaproteobacteria bacterium]|nr:sugar nucleotide-binding protein [Alphaproteobacteria bacterium]
MYLIVGANGFLGSYLIKNILELTSDNILATDLICPEENNPRVAWQRCDITSEDNLRELYERTKEQKLKVLFLAAYHHPDAVLKNPQIAWNVNVVALAKFLGLFDNIATMYYPSTEVVYGEMKDRPFKEDDPLNPVSRYGELKTVAERMVNVAGFNVVRFPVLMGPSLLKDKKHFYDEIVETVKNGGEMEMFADQTRSMIDFDTAAKVVVLLVENDAAHQYPIVNISGDEALSKYELGVRICHANNLDDKKIKPISLDGDNTIFTAKRAKSTLLDNSLVKSILGLDELKIKV